MITTRKTTMRTLTVLIALLVGLATTAGAFHSSAKLRCARPVTSSSAPMVRRSLSTTPTDDDRAPLERYEEPRKQVRSIRETAPTTSAPQPLSRRRVMVVVSSTWGAALAIGSAGLVQPPAPARAEDTKDSLLSPPPPPLPTKVLVLGGTGFVGSQVVSVLRDLGVAVLATSTDGRDNTLAIDLTSRNDQDRLSKVLRNEQVTAIVSCVGTINTNRDEAVNAGTGAIAPYAKAAGVQRFVYITVSPEVKDLAKDVEFLQGYLRGKAFSRESVLTQFGDAAVLIEPTFIYGGGSFETNPPRVPSFYGRFIEGLLSASPIRQVERVLSPGLLKIALEPPLPVEAVARAAVAGALGKSPRPILDSYDNIREAAATLEMAVPPHSS